MRPPPPPCQPPAALLASKGQVRELAGVEALYVSCRDELARLDTENQELKDMMAVGAQELGTSRWVCMWWVGERGGGGAQGHDGCRALGLKWVCVGVRVCVCMCVCVCWEGVYVADGYTPPLTRILQALSPAPMTLSSPPHTPPPPDQDPAGTVSRPCAPQGATCQIIGQAVCGQGSQGGGPGQPE